MSSTPSSLRVRLAVTMLVWSALLCTLLGVLLERVRGETTLDEIDTRIRALAGYVQQAARSRDHQPPTDVMDVRSVVQSQVFGSNWFLVLFGADGAVVARSRGTAPLERRVLPALPVGASSGGPARPLETAPQFITLPPPLPEAPDRSEAPVRARVAVFRLTQVDAGDDVLVVGCTLDSYDLVTARVRHSFMTFAGVATLLAACGGWFGAGALVRRVRTIATQAAAVTPRALEGGVRLPEGPDELGRMGAALNGMLDGLRDAFRSQERFLSDVSHEFKTPLSSLLVEAQVLRRPDATLEEHQAFAASAEDEARRLGKLVESFLLLVRVEHGKHFMAEGLFSLNEVALEATGHSMLLASQNGVAIVVRAYDPFDGVDPLILGDADLLAVALDNIVRNAVQASSAGEAVRVELARVDDTMVVSVIDSGPGVPPEQLPVIFDRFHQAGPRSTRRRGAGLGLSIAKRIVELHGGGISAENRAEGGCCFRVVLPLADQRERPNGRAPQPESGRLGAPA